MALVDRLTAFLKASFLYPSNNTRVVEAADTLIESYIEVGGDERWISVRFTAESVRVNQLELEVQGALVPWARDTFTKARLAGVELGPGFDPEALTQFVESLRQSMIASKDDMAATWEKQRAGVRPLELLYSGDHGTGVVAEDEAVGLADLSGPSTALRFDGDSPQARLFERLQGDDVVARRCAEIQRRVDSRLVDRGDLVKINVLAEAVAFLPTDVMRDTNQAQSAVLEILSRTSVDVLAGIQTGEIDADVGLTTLFKSVAQKFFQVDWDEESEESEREQLPTGRPEDEAIQEDLEALLEEVEALPHPGPVDLLEDTTRVNEELLGVFLHQLRGTAEPETLARFEERTLAMLENPSSMQLRVLDQYVSAAISDAHDERGWRLIDLLRRTGLSSLLQRAEHLSPEVVVFSFPDLFVLFVDTIELEPASLDMLRDVCGSVHADRIEQAADVLCGSDGILRADRIDKLLAVGTSEVLPFATLVAEHGNSAALNQIGLFLRKLETPEIEGLALRAVDDPALLPSGYLISLCRCTLDGRGDEKLREYSAFLLRNFILETDAPELVDRRVYAIRSLRYLPSAETIMLLKKLCGPASLLKFGKHNRAVRTAALETLKSITG